MNPAFRDGACHALRISVDLITGHALPAGLAQAKSKATVGIHARVAKAAASACVRRVLQT